MRSIVYSVLSALTVYVFLNITSTPEPARPSQDFFVEAEPVEEVLESAEPEIEIDTFQLNCLAQNIYHEARGESYRGKVAVANVTMNRVRSKKFPGTICGVVKQAVYSRWWKEHHNKNVPVRHMCQFSWYCDGKSDSVLLTDSNGTVIKANMDAWQDSLEIAKLALLGDLSDITAGATHYYNPDLANPDWAKHFVMVGQIGNHAFHRM